MYFNLLRWFSLLILLYVVGIYSYTMLSAENFVFIIEGLYLCIAISFLSGLYIHSVRQLSLLEKVYISHYEQLYVGSHFLKKINIRLSILYRFCH